MSEYRLFKVTRTDGQKYFDIEYVRDVVTCGECAYRNNREKCPMRVFTSDNGFCCCGERK